MPSDREHRLVASFHLPAEACRERFERWQQTELKRLAGAVVVASSQYDDFARWLGPEKVLFVPHGIDTNVFVPAPERHAGPLRLVLVGMHLRDFEVMHDVIDRCFYSGLDVQFHVVMPENKYEFFISCKNVRRHGRISEEALVKLYQSSDALFIPVLNATANNAVLESLACGTPVISTRIGGIGDYLSENCGWLLPPRDAEAAFQCVQALAANPALVREKRDAARRKAEQFSWEKVASSLSAAYRRLIATGRFGL